MTTLKTDGKYGYDSLIVTDAKMQVLNAYISCVIHCLNPSVILFSSTEMAANTVNWARS